MTEEDTSTLLGRPLTTIEHANFGTYSEIAKESLEELLCISLDDQDSSSGIAEETRVFNVREGYSTVFTDIFTKLSEVKVDGIETTDYYPAFWDKRNSTYFNSIVLDNREGSEVSITGYWGFESIPSDLKLLWAQLFANVSKKYKAGGGNIKSKQVEDFRVTYGDLTDDETFMADNSRIIKKYSMCNIGDIRHGEACIAHGRYNCGYCI